MIKALLILTILIVSWFVWRHFQTKSESVSISLPVAKTKTDSHVIDSLRLQLQKTCDSLNSYKPVIDSAIQKLRFYDSIFQNTSLKTFDTLWIKRMRSDLYEARQEIRRLCIPHYYRVYFKPE